MGNTPLEKYFAKIARKKEEKARYRKTLWTNILIGVVIATVTTLLNLAIIYIQ
mgnify:FL=1